MLDLVILRHGLAFALVIDDINYSKKRFTKNFEAEKNLKRLSLDELREDLARENYLLPFSAGLLHLAMNEKRISEYLKY